MTLVAVPVVPTQAESVYVGFLNQTRLQEWLIPDPTGTRVIPASVPTKWAILSVLSTRCPLSVHAIQVLLNELSYPRSINALQTGLVRGLTFGLVEKQKNHLYETNILRSPTAKRRRHNKWKLTSKGRELLNTPRKVMKKETNAEKILVEMTKATKWMAVSDLQSLIGCSTSAIRRNLRKNEFQPASSTGLYKSQKILGDQHGRNQWALESLDTTGWANAAPIASLPKTKKSKKQSTPMAVSAGIFQPATYGGLTLMCAPANKPSLIKAVGNLLVNEFVTSGKRFSAYDITKRLRELVFDQMQNLDTNFTKKGIRQTYVPIVDWTETGKVHTKGLEVAKVEHEDVKAIVHDIFNSGGMPNLAREMNVGGYWEYDTQANIDAAQVPAPLPVATVVSIGISTGSSDPVADGTPGSSYDGSSTI